MKKPRLNLEQRIRINLVREKDASRILKEYMTINDISDYFECNYSTIEAIKRRYLIKDTDYISIESNEFDYYRNKYNIRIGNKARKITLINKTGLIKIILKLRDNKVARNIKNKVNMQDMKITRKEISFLDELEEALRPFNIKGIRQYKVDNYRIDYYIPELNIAIEYDENDHIGYTYEQQGYRQVYIENRIGCTFIRLSDKNSNAYNIGLTIKEIIKIYSIF